MLSGIYQNSEDKEIDGTCSNSRSLKNSPGGRELGPDDPRRRVNAPCRHGTDNGHEEVEKNRRMRPTLDCRLFPCIGIFFDGRVETDPVDSRT